MMQSKEEWCNHLVEVNGHIELYRYALQAMKGGDYVIDRQSHTDS